MPLSELDQKFDAAIAAVTGPDGRVIIGTDALGQAFVSNFPPTLPMFFKVFCALNGAVEGVVSDGERLTFASLDAMSDKVARGLMAKGVAKGDRVGIAMRNCPSWIILYMATLKTGAIATLINGWWQVDELAHALQLTEPVLVLADPARRKRISAAGWTGSVETIEVDQKIEAAMAGLMVDGDAPFPDVLPTDDATILFTSGSTGEAKGAVSTHLAVVTGVYAYATGLMALRAILDSEGKPALYPIKTLLNVPLFHVTGEVPVMLNSFVIGRGLVLLNKWDAGEALRLIERERITYFVGVPTMSMELMNHPDRGNYDLSSLTDIAAGGAPRPVSHVDRLKQAFPGAQPALGYGLTETNAVGCGNFWGNYAAKPASTGRAQPPFVDIAILDDDGNHLATGHHGEIAIRSAANIRGYWRNDEATAAAFAADNYIRTGDIGYLDEDGYLFIVDRKKDIIIRGGENISAAEVEAALYGCEGVAEAAVFGARDERLGEVPVAIIHRREGSQLTAEELREFLQGRLAAYKVPEQISFSTDPLPRLGTGKIDRVLLKQKISR